jgi:hypothetical protein
VPQGPGFKGHREALAVAEFKAPRVMWVRKGFLGVREFRVTRDSKEIWEFREPKVPRVM